MERTLFPGKKRAYWILERGNLNSGDDIGCLANKYIRREGAANLQAWQPRYSYGATQHSPYLPLLWCLQLWAKSALDYKNPCTCIDRQGPRVSATSGFLGHAQLGRRAKFRKLRRAVYPSMEVWNYVRDEYFVSVARGSERAPWKSQHASTPVWYNQPRCVFCEINTISPTVISDQREYYFVRPNSDSAYDH
jgi:hypothetical protein